MRYFLILCMLLPAPVLGQGAPGRAVEARERCQVDSTLVAAVDTSAAGRRALDRLVACTSERGSAAAAGLRRLRHAGDRRLLERYAAFGWDGDTAVTSALADVAGDRLASVPARVVAFGRMTALLRPGRAIRYEQLTGGLDEWGFPVGSCGGHAAHSAEVALRPEDAANFRSLARRVRADTTEPPDVRSAAACVGG